jgi:hypothetical protein
MGPRIILDAVVTSNNPSPCRESNPARPTRSLVTVLNELPRLFYFYITIYALLMKAIFVQVGFS